MSDLEANLRSLRPAMPGFDRDALLYAAGRASAKPRFPWRVLCTVLALTQFATLAWFLIPRESPPQISPVPSPIVPTPSAPGPVSPEPTSYIALMHHLDEEPTPSSFGASVDADPPLTPRSRFE